MHFILNKSKKGVSNGQCLLESFLILIVFHMYLENLPKAKVLLALDQHIVNICWVSRQINGHNIVLTDDPLTCDIEDAKIFSFADAKDCESLTEMICKN